MRLTKQVEDGMKYLIELEKYELKAHRNYPRLVQLVEWELRMFSVSNSTTKSIKRPSLLSTLPPETVGTLTRSNSIVISNNLKSSDQLNNKTNKENEPKSFTRPEAIEIIDTLIIALN